MTDQPVRGVADVHERGHALLGQLWRHEPGVVRVCDGDAAGEVHAALLDRLHVLRPAGSEVDALALDDPVGGVLEPGAGKLGAVREDRARRPLRLVAEVAELLEADVREARARELLGDELAAPRLAGRPGEAIPERNDALERPPEAGGIERRHRLGRFRAQSSRISAAESAGAP